MSHSAHHDLKESSFHLNPETAKKVTNLGLILGSVGLLATGAGMAMGGETKLQALHSYLVAYFYFATLAVGALFFALLQHLVGAVWSVVVRRLAEVIASVLPVMIVLFLPLALFASDLFPWAGALGSKPAVAAKAAYLNMPFFLIRAAVYLAIWGGLGFYLLSRSLKQDQTGDPFILVGLRNLAAPAMFAFGLSLTFAGFDWLMSLDPEWYSTIFGVYIFAGTVVSSLSMLILVALKLRKQGVLDGIITVEHYHDLGKLTFGFIVFWTYIAFSNFFLIWYSNIPEETVWFVHRWKGSWATMSVILILGHFTIPFFSLLSRNAKRSLKILGIVTPWLLVFHYVDLHWLVMPQLHHEGVSPSWLDITAFVGIGGLTVGLTAKKMGSVALLPVGDPRLSASMEFENA